MYSHPIICKSRLAFGVLLLFVVFCLLIPTGVRADADYTETVTQQPVDYMVVCAHPGDEFLFLRGILPLYARAQGRRVAVVYMSSNSAQQQEASSALSLMSESIVPVFAPFQNIYVESLEDAEKFYSAPEIKKYLKEVMDTYCPAVVFSHDLNGEYGHGFHSLTAKCLLQVIQQIGRVSEKATQPWMVSRLYLHLYESDEILDLDQLAAGQYDGQDPVLLERQCYASYTGSNAYPIRIGRDNPYSHAKYGMAFSDGKALELSATQAPCKTLTPQTASPTAMRTPSPVPTIRLEAPVSPQADTVKPEPARGSPVGGSEQINVRLRASLILLGITLISGWIWIRIQKKALYVWLWCLCIGAVGALCIYCAVCVPPKPSKIVEAAADITATPQPTGAQTPTVSLEPSPTPSATPTPHPWDIYFRREDDPAEVVVSDWENEHWEYRTDILSILIDRIHTKTAAGRPICYSVANIRMREADAFRAGLREAGHGPEPLWEMARRYQAVLAITGDNINRAEAELKGILMRNGTLYSRLQGQDTLALFPDMTMRIYKRKTISPEKLLDMGVQNTFSFGPTLLYQGKFDETSRRTTLGKVNPRCGLGFVAPGHFVAIVADGRQSDYSVGISIRAFAQLFYSHGCVEAHNLDGGSSAAMVFMGEHLNQHSGVGSDIPHKLIDALMWGNSALVPDVSDPIQHSGDANLDKQ